jgi:hypothetical protein
MEKYKSEIIGHLDIFTAQNEDEMNQKENTNLPIGEREHIHLQPKYDISNSSEEVIIGRLDAKGSGLFYERYISREK